MDNTEKISEKPSAVTEEDIKMIADTIGGDEEQRRDMEAFLRWVVGNDE